MLDTSQMSSEEIERLVARVLEYPHSINHYDTLDFIGLDIPPDYVEMFKACSAKDIIVGFFLGLSPKDIQHEMSGICDWSQPYHELMGFGASAVVIRLRDEHGECVTPVMKIGKDLANEYNIWEKVQDSPLFLHPSYVHQKSLDILSHETSGSTLDNQLNRLLSGLPTILFYPENIFKDTFEQLDELRNRGISYVDLRPQNVLMIDRVECRPRFNIFTNVPSDDRCRLLDFGESSDDPSHIPACNRRYGGSDLMSLGQLVYKCTTWDKNLFNDYTKSSHEAADDIRKNRVLFCNDPAVREKYIRKIDETIPRKEIAEMIKACLLAGISLGENPLSCPQDVRDAAYAEVRVFYEMLKR